MSNIDTPTPPDNIKIFQALCDARAQLWAIGEFGHDDRALHEAVDWLEMKGRGLVFDVDLRQRIMARAFARFRDDLGGWVPW